MPQFLDSLQNSIADTQRVKIIFIILISAFIGVSLAIGGDYSYATLWVIFGVFFFMYCLRQPYVNLILFMIAAFLFLPFHYVPFLNIFNAINPLTFLGTALAVKIFFDKVMKNSGPWSLRIEKIDKIYFIFIISALVSTCSAKSVLGALNWIFYSIVIGYIPFKVITYLERGEINKIIRAIVILGSLCAFEGIVEYSLQHSILYPVFQGRLTSLLGHPLTNGILFSTFFPYSLFLYSRTKEKKFIGCAIIFFTAIILTQARGSWIALTSGLIFVLLIAPVKVKIRLIIAILMVSATIAAVPSFRNTISSRAREYEGQKYSSWNIRLESIPVALDIIKDKPFFGGGPFNSGRYKDEYASDITLRETTFENSYLGLLVDFGLVGCVLLFSIYFLVLQRVLSAIKLIRRNDYALYFVLWSLVSMFINMGTFNFDSYRAFSFVVWFFMGAAVSLSRFFASYPLEDRT